MGMVSGHFLVEEFEFHSNRAVEYILERGYSGFDPETRHRQKGKALTQPQSKDNLG